MLLEPGLVDRMLRDLRASDGAEPTSGNGGLSLLLRMVRLGEGGAEDTRRRIRRTELSTADAVARVLTAFADARLVYD